MIQSSFLTENRAFLKHPITSVAANNIDCRFLTCFNGCECEGLRWQLRESRRECPLAQVTDFTVFADSTNNWYLTFYIPCEEVFVFVQKNDIPSKNTCTGLSSSLLIFSNGSLIHIHSTYLLYMEGRGEWMGGAPWQHLLNYIPIMGNLYKLSISDTA